MEANRKSLSDHNQWSQINKSMCAVPRAACLRPLTTATSLKSWSEEQEEAAPLRPLPPILIPSLLHKRRPSSGKHKSSSPICCYPPPPLYPTPSSFSSSSSSSFSDELSWHRRMTPQACPRINDELTMWSPPSVTLQC